MRANLADYLLQVAPGGRNNPNTSALVQARGPAEPNSPCPVRNQPPPPPPLSTVAARSAAARMPAPEEPPRPARRGPRRICIADLPPGGCR